MDLPAEPQLRWILRHTAALLQHGAEPVRGLVLPSGEFFPDRFDGTPKTLPALTSRVLEHAGLADLRVEISIVTPEGASQSVSCSSGACGGTGKIEAKSDRVARRDDGSYTVVIGAGELKNPVVLTTALVRAVAFMFLSEADAYRLAPKPDREPLTDLAATLLGFGVLVANGSYLYVKGCGGVQVHSATRMPVDELTVALAVFCKLHDVPARTASRHLEVTPRAHFDEASAWASSNASIVRKLRAAPDAIEADRYTLSPARSWLSRALGFGASKRPATPEDELAELERAAVSAPREPTAKRDRPNAKKLAELRALVDESLEN